jgi:hypothetical protein
VDIDLDRAVIRANTALHTARRIGDDMSLRKHGAAFAAFFEDIQESQNPLAPYSFQVETLPFKKL